jgi:hypothetical protein
MPFRVVTFNMQNGQPWRDDDPFPPVVDVDAVANFLNGLNADIICLQEVERGHDGGMQVDPPPHYMRLKELLTGYDSVFAYPLKNDTELPFGLGLAIFSRTKLTDFHKTDLPSAQLDFVFEGKKRRTSSRLLIEVSTILEGRRLKVLNTHLQAFFMIGDSSDAHPEQRSIVESKLRAVAGRAKRGNHLAPDAVCNGSFVFQRSAASRFPPCREDGCFGSPRRRCRF